VTGMEEKLEQARETLQLVTAYDKEFAAQAERLVKVELELREMDEVLKLALPERQRSDENVEAIKTNTAGSTTIHDEHRKTGWGLVNGFTEWMEHLRPVRSQEGRFHNIVDGEGARSRDRLVKVLLTR
jgi:DNA repair ATPase RecN